jgi:hypothetical protein
MGGCVVVKMRKELRRRGNEKEGEEVFVCCYRR